LNNTSSLTLQPMLRLTPFNPHPQNHRMVGVGRDLCGSSPNTRSSSVKPTGISSPSLKQKETPSYFYINIQTQKTKGNKLQTTLHKQWVFHLWPKWTQQQSHARQPRQVSPGQRLQLLSSAVLVLQEES